MEDTQGKLKRKLKILSEILWNEKIKNHHIEDWKSNFNNQFAKSISSDREEDIHALYLLSKFMYFGSYEIRELLKSLYRDLIRYPIIAKIRRDNNDTTNLDIIEEKFKTELSLTRFVAVGNPSDSSMHLLYYFRQENKLKRKLFINSHDIFNRLDSGKVELTSKNVKRYIFLDDFCGSGSQAKRFTKDIELIKDLSGKREVIVNYYTLFATSDGLEIVRELKRFNDVKAIYTFDNSFKCFADESRYFHESYPEIDKEFAKGMAEFYGNLLADASPGRDCQPLGYGECQLLLGFFHNTPNNTLPIIWFEEEGNQWRPIFKRYPKIY